MAETTLELLVKLRDDASAQLKQMNAEIKSNTKEWKDNYGAISLALGGIGLGLSKMGNEITGFFGEAYKAGEDQRIQTSVLANTLKNLGTSYDSVKSSLNGYLDLTQKSTGIAKQEQVAGLQQLLLTTHDYGKAMELLPIALDLAKAKQMDVTTSALLLGRVAEGNINALQRYGFSMEGIKSPGEALIKIQNDVKDSATQAKSPLDDLNNAIKDFKENIGLLVSGAMGNLIKVVSDAIEKFNKWATDNPELASTILDIALAVGIASILLGGLVLGALALAGALAIVNPYVLLAIGVITLLAAGAIFVIEKWDWFKARWEIIWMAVKGALLLFQPELYLIAILIDLAVALATAWDTTKGVWENVWNEMKAIAQWAINEIVDLLNFFLSPIEAVFHFKIPKITDDMWGIYRNNSPKYTGQGYGPGPTGFEFPGMGNVPVGGGLAGIFGNYGNIGQTGVLPGGQTINVTINNQGSVISQQDLMQQIRQALLQLQLKTVGTGIRQ